MSFDSSGYPVHRCHLGSWKVQFHSTAGSPRIERRSGLLQDTQSLTTPETRRKSGWAAVAWRCAVIIDKVHPGECSRQDCAFGDGKMRLLSAPLQGTVFRTVVLPGRADLVDCRQLPIPIPNQEN